MGKPPVNLNKTESLTDLVRRVHNRKVKEKFSSVTADDEFDAPEGRLKFKCLIKDKDSILFSILRILLFKFYCSDALDDITDNIYGIPYVDFKTHYNVVLALKFQEKPPYDSGTTPKRLQISLPLTIKPEDVTELTLNTLKRKLNTNFPEIYKHYCGKNYYSYYDRNFQHRFKVPARNANEAEILYQKMFELIDLDFEKSSFKEISKTTNTQNNSTVRVLGKTRKKVKTQKFGSVELKQAVLEIGNYEREYLIYRS